MSKFLWKIGGEAGFGIMTTGLVFSKIASRSGYNIFDYFQYPSLIRGGHNSYEVVFSEVQVKSLKQQIDFLVCLNKDTFDFNHTRVTSSTYVVYDNEEFNIQEEFTKINVPFKKILSRLKGQDVMKNIIALGASLALLSADINILYDIIEDQFGKKGELIVNINKKFAEEGFNHINKNYRNLIKPYLQKKKSTEKLVATGNDIFSLGSVIADCRFYAAYPMTPSSSVLSTLASWQEKTGMIVRHAEDEISVINTALGASFAGARSSVGTSGGGFALMVESVSFAGIAELPIVIFIASRPGPATGMPTWTEQGDLLFAVHAGHGEFPKIVLAPGDVSEMLELTVKAYDLSDIYQTPVIILSDMFLSEAHKTLESSFVERLVLNYKINRGKTVNLPTDTDKDYKRYKLIDDGISERLIPGANNFFYQVNSYEHIEDGHTTEDAKARVQQVDKRNNKLSSYIRNDFQLPKVYGDIDKSDTVFVSWGSTKGIILESQEMLKEKGKKTAFIHFTHVYPLSYEKIKPFFRANKRYILVENNLQGQFGRLLRQETGITIEEKLLKYDGRPFWVEEIVERVARSV